ncbi:MAG: hypothetical protein PHU72_03990 [Dethiosulfovibrio sp.]|nr:hypothetical protein [Dethiosulfovibrio sp.]
MKNRPAVFAIMGAFVLMAQTLSAGEVNIPRLVQEAPPLETYGSPAGVVWQRHESYGLRPDGAMLKESLWVVMTTHRLDRNWPESVLSTPFTGELEILEANLYDPVSGAKIASLPDDGSYMSLGDHDEAVLVLRFRQIYPKRMSVEGLITPASDLPVWEGRFSVAIPSGSELFVQSNGMDSPTIDNAGGKSIYLWTTYNVPQRKRPSMIRLGDPYLAFSLRSGKVPFLQLLSTLNKVPVPPMPPELARLNRMGDKGKAGKRLMRAMDSMVIPGSDGMLREDIPSEGPWSYWERALILRSWLEDMGWRAQLVWRTFLPIGAQEPAMMENLRSPVLRVAPPGSDYWFYVPGQTVEPGNVPPSLIGKTLYGGSPEEGLLTYSLDRGKVEDHRLTIAWNLALDPQGALTGTLQLWVRNGWLEIFPDKDRISWVGLESVIPGLLAWKAGDPSLTPMDYGYRIDLPVKRHMGIPGGPGMLMRMPCLLPGALEDLTSLAPNKELLFPFVMEQKYTIALPGGYSLISTPAMSDRNEGALKFSEYLRFSKKREVLEGESKIIANSSRYDDQFTYGLPRVLGAWLRWRDISIPLAMKK